MTYAEAVSYISGLPKFTSKNPNAHTTEFLRRLGVQEETCGSIIHVAGTNGKGSVCALVETMLLAEGKRTGMFISPHLVKMNERIRIDGQQVSDAEFARLFKAAEKTADEMGKDGLPHPSFFEFLFGMAMKAFVDAGSEYIILETGLGGRLDATNVCKRPLVSLITSIGLDHTEILGDTIEEIAYEKAGIIKPGVPVYFQGGSASVSDVIRRAAEKAGAPCREISKNAYEIQEIDSKHIAFLSASAYYEDITWHLPGCGYYQVMNAVLALEAMQDILKGGDMHPLAWRDALAEFRWEGRMEEVLPGVVVDGAHNMDALRAFVKSTRMQDRPEKVVILFSAVQDKDYREMLAYLCREMRADIYMITKISDIRGVRPGELAGICREYTDSPVFVEDDVREAFARALRERGENGRVYCLGSLYLVGMLEELVKEEKGCLTMKKN